MLLELIEYMRRWERHVLTCKQCDMYDSASGPADCINKSPCGVGRAIILNLLKILEKGL